jgi:hypothetical protein
VGVKVKVKVKVIVQPSLPKLPMNKSKEKLSVQPPAAKVPPTKSQFGQSVKMSFLKGIESFCCDGPEWFLMRLRIR